MAMMIPVEFHASGIGQTGFAERAGRIKGYEP